MKESCVFTLQVWFFFGYPLKMPLGTTFTRSIINTMGMFHCQIVGRRQIMCYGDELILLQNITAYVVRSHTSLHLQQLVKKKITLVQKCLVDFKSTLFHIEYVQTFKEKSTPECFGSFVQTCPMDIWSESVSSMRGTPRSGVRSSVFGASWNCCHISYSTGCC